jgi:hypothetical protein
MPCHAVPGGLPLDAERTVVAVHGQLGGYGAYVVVVMITLRFPEIRLLWWRQSLETQVAWFGKAAIPFRRVARVYCPLLTWLADVLLRSSSSSITSLSRVGW